MSYFTRGCHRRNRFSITVAELVAESKRITIGELFEMLNREWAKR